MIKGNIQKRLTHKIGLLLTTFFLFNANVNADVSADVELLEEVETCPTEMSTDSTAGNLIQCFEGPHIGRDMLTLAMNGEVGGIDFFNGALEGELAGMGIQLVGDDHLLVRPRNGVTPYLLYYWTLDKEGEPTMAAGWVLVPGYSSDSPILESAWLLHMPWIRFNTNPLDIKNMMAVLTGGILGAGKGHTAVVPELLGFNPLRGTPKDPFVNLNMTEPDETFIDIETQASAATDLLRAAKIFCDSQNSRYCGPAAPLATELPKLFIHGYSQGGHGGMAALERIQNQADGDPEFRLEAAAFAGGYYNMIDDVEAWGAKEYSDPRFPESGPQSFSLQATPLLARHKAFLVMDQLSITPYFESLDSPAPGLQCGTYDELELNEEGHNECIDSWLSDYVGTWPEPVSGSETEAADELKLAQLAKIEDFLYENSMVTPNDETIFKPRFTPHIPLRLSSCESDDWVSPGVHTASLAIALGNADVEVDYVFKEDTIHDGLEGDATTYIGHEGCALPLIGLNFNWFASFQPWENPFIVDVGVQRQFQICFFGCKGYYTLALDGWALSLLEQPDQPVTIYVDGEVITEDFTASSIFYSNFYWVGSTHTVKACWPGDWCNETTFVAY